MADEPDITARAVARDIRNGNRADARLAIRMHSDPAWFVLEVLTELQKIEGSIAAADIRRLMSV